MSIGTTGLMPSAMLGSLRFASAAQILPAAKNVAEQVGALVQELKLFVERDGKKHLRLEAWTTLGGIIGVVPQERMTSAMPDGGFESGVDLVRAADGGIVGRASAVCGAADDSEWCGQPDFVKRSMAITRATAKAFRLTYSWIMALGGFEVTPTEELPNTAGKSLHRTRYENRIAELAKLGDVDGLTEFRGLIDDDTRLRARERLSLGRMVAETLRQLKARKAGRARRSRASK